MAILLGTRRASNRVLDDLVAGAGGLQLGRVSEVAEEGDARDGSGRGGAEGAEGGRGEGGATGEEGRHFVCLVYLAGELGDLIVG